MHHKARLCRRSILRRNESRLYLSRPLLPARRATTNALTTMIRGLVHRIGRNRACQSVRSDIDQRMNRSISPRCRYLYRSRDEIGWCRGPYPMEQDCRSIQNVAAAKDRHRSSLPLPTGPEEGLRPSSYVFKQKRDLMAQCGVSAHSGRIWLSLSADLRLRDWCVSSSHPSYICMSSSIRRPR